MATALELTSQTFSQEVLHSDIPVLVDFWAPWCGPCRAMAPILDELSGELAGKVKITKINVDDPAHIQIAQQYQISSIPNMKLFRNGSVVTDFIGSRPKATLLQELDAALR